MFARPTRPSAAAKHFNPEQGMDIALTVVQYMMTSRIVETVDIELQPLSAPSGQTYPRCLEEAPQL